MSNQTDQRPAELVVAEQYRERDHGFFPELLRMVVSTSAVAIACELHKSRSVRPYKSGDFVVIEGKREVSGIELQFFPEPIYRFLVSPTKRLPRFMTVIKKEIAKCSPKHPIQVDKIQLLIARLVGDAFMSYYERYLDAVEELWGKEKKGRWPPNWQFGWAIRNACAHNGKIHFRDKGHAPVKWRTLQYDFSDNGRTVLFDEMAGAELVLLMEDMDAELRSAQLLAQK